MSKKKRNDKMDDNFPHINKQKTEESDKKKTG